MTDGPFPVYVKHWSEEHPADAVICTKCLKEWTWNPEDGDVYDRCVLCDGCGGVVTYKWQEADECPGCFELGFWEQSLQGCCSRACMLANEWAEKLESEDTLRSATLERLGSE